MKYVYLHGFASGAASTKARYFAERMRECEVDLATPDLAAGDFEHLTISGQLAVIDAEVGGDAAVLIGSSMGGYLAALYASAHTNIARVLLLAPAFHFIERWIADLGPERVGAWRDTGFTTVYHYGEGRECRLGYGLIEDSSLHPAEPSFTQPGLIFHGTRDDVVPSQLSSEFAARHPNAELVLFDSDHQLTDVLPRIWTAAEPFLFAASGAPPASAG